MVCIFQLSENILQRQKDAKLFTAKAHEVINESGPTWNTS